MTTTSRVFHLKFKRSCKRSDRPSSKPRPKRLEAIKYQIPTFVLNGNLVSFAAYKQHIGLYPIPAGTQKFQKAIAVYRAAKSTLRFPLDEPIPYDLIGQLVKYLVKERAASAKARQQK